MFKNATIASNRAGGIDCLVRNISDGGACLDVANPLGIPSDFDLLFTSDHAVRPCDQRMDCLQVAVLSGLAVQAPP